MSYIPRSYFTQNILNSRQILRQVSYSDANNQNYFFSIPAIAEYFSLISIKERTINTIPNEEFAKIYSLNSNEEGPLAFLNFTETPGVLSYTESLENPIITKIYINLMKNNIQITDTIFLFADKNTTIYFPYNKFVIVFSNNLALPIMIQSQITISYNFDNETYFIEFKSLLPKGN